MGRGEIDAAPAGFAPFGSLASLDFQIVLLTICRIRSHFQPFSTY